MFSSSLARFWPENFLFLASTTAAAATTEGEFTLHGFFVTHSEAYTLITYNFTYCIVSDKHFL
jgi:hypothetical protein